MQETAYITLGTNIGDREKNLTDALRRIHSSEGIEVVRKSSFYETEPLGPPQPKFLNAAAGLRCSIQPDELLKALKNVETEMGRKEGPRWGPRVIDLDIVLFGNRVVESEEISIPHREMTKRTFVLEPLAEIAANEIHPISGKTVAELLRELTGAEKENATV